MSGVSSGALLGMSAATTAVVIVIVVVVVVLLVVAWAMARSRRRSSLRSSFGPEYDVAVSDSRNRTAAERDLQQRLDRHETLPLRELTPESQSRYLAAWQDLQAGFVDRPRHAVAEADELIRSAMVERGYPAQSFDQQVADLSVEHAGTLDAYRDAHRLATLAPDQQTTEHLRRAVVGYRQLFVDIVGVTPGAAPAAEPSQAPADVDLRTDAAAPARRDPTV
jgi:FtsZ-interacting cell division protein ZipA